MFFVLIVTATGLDSSHRVKMSDYLSDFLLKCKAQDDKNDVILNLLLKYIITTDKSLSIDTR